MATIRVSPRERVAVPDGGTARNSPVIVLTYGNAGGLRLQALLESQPELTCTTSTGILAACEHAAAAWKQVEGRRPDQDLPQIGVKSVRSMATQMITMLTARTGRPRWCELAAAADPAAAEVFLKAFPGTRFLCLHRSCPDLVSALLLASPWGLSGPAFAPYVAAYPGSTVAALTAWWVARARPVLDFERAHPDSCLRLDYADLAENGDAALARIRSFLTLDSPTAASAPPGGPVPPAVPVPPGVTAQPPAAAADRDLAADLPLDQLPPPLLAQVNELHRDLGYPPLGPG